MASVGWEVSCEAGRVSEPREFAAWELVVGGNLHGWWSRGTDWSDKRLV